MRQVMYKLGYELGACVKLLLSKESIPLWIVLSIVYLLKGN